MPQLDWLNPRACEDHGAPHAPPPQDEGRQGPCEIHLDLASLWLANSPGNERPEPNKYSKNGAGPSRILRVLAAGYSCRTRCREQVKPKALIAFCDQFHAMTDEAQAHYLYSCYDAASGLPAQTGDSEAPPGQRRHTIWHLLGVRVSVDCLAAMLGVGPMALYKECHGQFNMRKQANTKRLWECPQSLLVEQLFCEVY